MAIICGGSPASPRCLGTLKPGFESCLLITYRMVLSRVATSALASRAACSPLPGTSFSYSPGGGKRYGRKPTCREGLREPALGSLSSAPLGSPRGGVCSCPQPSRDPLDRHSAGGGVKDVDGAMAVLVICFLSQPRVRKGPVGGVLCNSQEGRRSTRQRSGRRVLSIGSGHGVGLGVLECAEVVALCPGGVGAWARHEQRRESS